MVTRSFSIDHLCEEHLLQCATVWEEAAVAKLGREARDRTTGGHTHLGEQVVGEGEWREWEGKFGVVRGVGSLHNQLIFGKQHAQLGVSVLKTSLCWKRRMYFLTTHMQNTHTHLVQWLPSRACHVLYYNIAVYEVGSDPGRVEHDSGLIQEHYADHVITYVTFLVHL